MTRITSTPGTTTAASNVAPKASSLSASIISRTSKTSTIPLDDSSSQNAVVNKIEKHINDVRRGYGNLSKDVSYLLGQQSSNASAILSQKNPRALALYSGYLSGLRYDRAARFVNGVEFGIKNLDQISKK